MENTDKLEILVRPDVDIVLSDIGGTTTHVSYVFGGTLPNGVKTPGIVEFFVNAGTDYFANKATDEERVLFEKVSKRIGLKGNELISHIGVEFDKGSLDPEFLRLLDPLSVEAYDTKAVKLYTFADVGPAIEKWTDEGIRVFMYSNGGPDAQKAILRNADYTNKSGQDLSMKMSGFFDPLAVGPKSEAESYRRICKEIGVDPRKVMFLTDVLKEATPAGQANIEYPTLVSRAGNKPLPEKTGYPVITTFEQLKLR